ncbi:glycosyltransferase [Leptolyngbya sp. 15MV]|nr:glycosyltransferase [Leptolyngbya sp. 15MV]
MSVRLDELLARELATPGPLPSVMPSGRPWPLISIVTPTRNQGETIEATIRSVLEQGYPAVEHIVVDGASTDGTAAVLERYRERLARVISEPDRGQSDAINKGMRQARGEIVGWLNSDDMLAPGALAAAAEALDRSGADVVSGVCLVPRGGELVRRHVTACGDGPLPLRELLDLERCWLDGQFFYQPEVLLTRRIWERAGGHVREDLYYSMDYELWLRLAEAGARLKVIGRPIALFCEHPAQKTAQTEGGGFRGELPAARARFLADRGGGDVPAGAPAARRRNGARMKLNTRDLIAGGILLAFAVAGYILNLDHTLGSARRMGPGYMPMLTFWLLGGLATAVIIIGLFNGPDPLEPWTRLEILAIPFSVIACVVVYFVALRLGAPGWYPLGFALLGAMLALSVAEGWRPIGLVHAGLAVFGLMLEQFGLMVSLAATIVVAAFAEPRHTVKGVIGMVIFLCVLCWWVFINQLDIRVPLWPVIFGQ